VSSKGRRCRYGSLGTLPGVIPVVGHGETKSRVVVDNGLNRRPQRVSRPIAGGHDEQFPFELCTTSTGSKEAQVAVRSRAQQ